MRWPTVKLLTMLLNNRAIQIQQCVLVSPLGRILQENQSDKSNCYRNLERFLFRLKEYGFGKIIYGKYVMRCAILYHLHNLKNAKNTHGEVLLLVACNFAKSNTPPWVFFTFFKLYKMYQIPQNIYANFSGVSRLMDLLSDSREVIRNDVRMK